MALALPQSTENNRALYLYSDSDYTISQITNYLAMGVTVLSLLLMAAGYFGAKLITL